MMTTFDACPGCQRPVPADAPGGLCPQCLMDQALIDGHESTVVPETSARASIVPPTAEELAPWFPQLEILEFIGAGGMGAVYRARQTALDRVVALKVLHNEVGREPAFAERFSREARALARLSHPHVVGVYESGRTGSYYYLVMEFVAGATLRRLIEGGQLDPGTALAMTPQICDALEYAHSEGVVHRDIKPENILVDDRGQVKIADFGLAKLTGNETDRATLTQPRQVMGTLHYMAPEQMRGSNDVDHRADIYSLGVVIYEMLTGELPIGRFEPPSQRVAVDVRIDEVVLRTLERDPDRRYQRIGQVKTELDTICRCPAGAPDSEKPPIPHPADLWPRATLAVCGLILTASFLPWGLSQPRNKIDYDYQFSMDQQGAVGGDSIYRRSGPLELGFLPEGTMCNAWNSSLGLRIVLSGGRLGENWPVQLPNWTVPMLATVIGTLLLYRRLGRAAPEYVIPLLAAAGGTQTIAALLAVAHRGQSRPAPYLVVIGFAWCFAICLVPTAVQLGRREWAKLGRRAATTDQA